MLTLDEIHARLFTDVNGYTVSSLGRERMGHSADPAYTYGEVAPHSMVTMLDAIPHTPGDVFYDLGSGTGKAVIYAAALGQFGKVVGIEIYDELHREAENIRQRYDSDIRPHLAPEQQKTVIEFRQDDIFGADFRDADVVFSHCCTCFTEELMQKLSEKLEHEMKPGARAILVTRGVSSPAFEFLGSLPCMMGWGQATLNIYRKL